MEECKGLSECEEFFERKVNFDDDFDKIKFVSNDNLPVGKLIYFPTITATIRCVLKQGDLFYPQVYLDDALYQNLLFKMISYEKIEDKFDYQPNVCNDCHDFSMTVIDLSDFFYY